MKALSKLATALVQNYAQVERHEIEFRLTQSVESLHDLRVSIRRIRSLLEFFEGIGWMPREAKKARRGLKDVFVAAARPRDLDVMIDAYKERGVDASLLATLQREREEGVHLLMKALSEESYIKAKKRLVKITQKADEDLLLNEEGVEELFKGLCDKSCQLLKQLQKGSFFDIPLSHELRKACKRVRYVAEHLERHEKILLPCKEAQSQLGRIHDLDYWLQWLTRASPQSPHIATLRDELDHAIILFNDFIKKDGLKPLCNESFTTTT